jgi:hypothetical protein
MKSLSPHFQKTNLQNLKRGVLQKHTIHTHYTLTLSHEVRLMYGGSHLM